MFYSEENLITYKKSCPKIELRTHFVLPFELANQEQQSLSHNTKKELARIIKLV